MRAVGANLLTPCFVGTLITVTGRFKATPFNFDEMKAPSQEVPLASVKIANREAEQQNPKNEPFGQSGTRCGLESVLRPSW